MKVDENTSYIGSELITVNTNPATFKVRCLSLLMTKIGQRGKIAGVAQSKTLGPLLQELGDLLLGTSGHTGSKERMTGTCFTRGEARIQGE